MTSYPSFRYEKQLWSQGYHLVIGIDEVGRGAFAGPVVAAAVAFSPDLTDFIQTLGINDSKKLSPQKRSALAKHIVRHARMYAVASIAVTTINRKGISRATFSAMRKALIGLKPGKQAFVLIDAFAVRYLKGVGRSRQRGIIRGDEKSISIAAASIIAKVHRDRLMIQLSKRYPHYGWGRNKGYGTKKHQQAIRAFGLTRHHRKQFVKS